MEDLWGIYSKHNSSLTARLMLSVSLGYIVQCTPLSLTNLFPPIFISEECTRWPRWRNDTRSQAVMYRFGESCLRLGYFWRVVVEVEWIFWELAMHAASMLGGWIKHEFACGWLDMTKRHEKPKVRTQSDLHLKSPLPTVLSHLAILSPLTAHQWPCPYVTKTCHWGWGTLEDYKRREDKRAPGGDKNNTFFNSVSMCAWH